MIDMERRDTLLANARQHLQAAFEDLDEVSRMYWNNEPEIENLRMRAGSLHNDVANYGIVLP